MRCLLCLLPLTAFVALGCDAGALATSGPLGDGGGGTETHTDPGGGPPTTSTSTTSVWSQCGNGVVEPGEGCDDGNAVEWDGCEPDCTRSAQWTASYDDSQSIEWIAVATSPDGGAVVAGRRGVPGDGKEHDIVVAHYDPSGALIWVQATGVGDGQSDEPFDVATDPVGAIYVAGSRTSLADPTFSEAPLVLKLDANGFASWTRVVEAPDKPGWIFPRAAHGIAVHNERVAVAASTGDLARWLGFDAQIGVPLWDEIVGPGAALAVAAHPIHGFAFFQESADGSMMVSRRSDVGSPLWDAQLVGGDVPQRAAMGFDPVAGRWAVVGPGWSTSWMFEVREVDGLPNSALALAGSRFVEGLAVDPAGARTLVGDAFTGNAPRRTFALHQASDGTVRWEVDLAAGMDASAHVYDVAVLPSGRVYVAGSAWTAGGGTSTHGVLWTLNP